MSISEIISFIKNNNIFDYDEITTKQAIITPILSILGWNTNNPNEVKLEFVVSQNPVKRVDYSLKINNVNAVFIEAKKTSEDLERHQEQLLNYAYGLGIKLAILTNGITWWFYLPYLERTTFRQRKFISINLKSQLLEDIEHNFDKYLNINNIRSGSAISEANFLLESRVRELEIDENLPNVWESVFSQPDDDIINLINKKLEQKCGFTAPEEKIKSFLLALPRTRNTAVENNTAAANTTNRNITITTQRLNYNRGGAIGLQPNNTMPPEGTECRLDMVRAGKTYYGVISGGLLKVDGYDPFRSFSAAASKITNTSRNGWTDWKIKLPNSTEWIIADKWRKSRR